MHTNADQSLDYKKYAKLAGYSSFKQYIVWSEWH